MKKNAFTLIELLAVIVILAIIALIAVPIVINIIEDAKEESLKRSVQNYLDGVTNTITKENLKVKYNPDECIIQEHGDLICSENGNELVTSNGTKELVIDIKGKKPSSGTIKLKDGKIVDIIDLFLNEKNYIFDDKGNIIINKVPTAPGLYDKNYKLVASWDELISKYGLKVENGELSNGIDALLNEELSSGCLLIISDSVKSIGDVAFCYCINLTNIIIPNSVTSIGLAAFLGCNGLTNINISNSVTSIGMSAFEYCTGLTSITIPSSVISIGDNAFKDCTNLKSVTIPDSVTDLGQYAFKNCTSLKNATIGNGLTYMFGYTFEECINLSSVTIGSGIEFFDPIAVFAGCSNLANIIVAKGNTMYEDRGANAIIEKATNKLLLGCKNTIIPNSVTSIGEGAFEYCTGLTSVVIPNNVTSIGHYTFNGCTNLTSVTFENKTGWFTTDSSTSTSGSNIDVTNPTTNATNLKDTYSNKYWKRS